MSAGRVKWFSAEKGFGFIIPEDGRGDVFVHHTAILSKGFRTLNKDDLVEFEITKDERGQKAERVVVVTTGAK